jgi:hypothetical protein
MPQAYDFQAELRTVIAAVPNDEMPPGLLSRIEQCFNEISTATASAEAHHHEHEVHCASAHTLTA